MFNVLVPGSGYWYVDQDRGHFIKTQVVGSTAIAALIVLGNIFQSTAGFPLPQGVCIGILLLIVLVPLFRNGQKAAFHHNFVLDNAAMYTTRQRGTGEAKLARNQSLRDKGYI
jgi:hypothetical protein